MVAPPPDEALSRLDSFPYRHRVDEVMSAPLVTADIATPLPEAAATMAARNISSLAVTRDGTVTGIVTERDVLRAVARTGGDVAETRLGELMSSPLCTVPGEALVYRALGRMDRLGLRHLGVVDAEGRPVGMISARQLLKQRSAGMLALGDQVEAAADAQALAEVHAALPGLAQQLLEGDMTALQVAGVLSAVLRDISARAAALAEAEVTAKLGPAPSPWCLLVLGSGGRGESLLSADQDNAIVHGGGDDAWFAALGQAAADILDQAGVPYCKGGIMAARPNWRGSLADWRRRVGGWLAAETDKVLLDVDVFYDFHPVHGDLALAAGLRREAVAAAARSRTLLRLLAAAADDFQPPLTLFGGLRSREGRIDLKLGGLMGLVGRVRVMALKAGVERTPTAERLRALERTGRLLPDEAEALSRAQELLLHLILNQQLRDIAAGRPPSPRVATGGLSRGTRAELRDALRHIDALRVLVQDTLTED